MNDWDLLISVEEVIDLHARGISKQKQIPVPVDKNLKDCVDAKLGNAWTSEGYVRAEDDALPGLAFASYALYYIARGYCFPDGNKRAAWSSCMAILATMGLTIKATDNDVVTFVERVATGEVKNGRDVIYWLASRLETPEDGPIN